MSKRKRKKKPLRTPTEQYVDYSTQEFLIDLPTGKAIVEIKVWIQPKEQDGR